MYNTINSRQVEAIAATLRTFQPDGGVVSIQGLHFRTARARAFNTSDLEEAARHAALFDAENPQGVYFLLNSIRPDFAGTRAFPKEEDVTRRLWLPIDADPVRPTAFAKASATIEERQAAWDVFRRCYGIMEGAGLSGEVIGDSGNGWHLCYPIDLPNDAASKELVKAVLQGLAKRCDDQAATVGTECHDARRIWPVYGTWKRKGPDLPDRPHRLTRLVEGVPWDCEKAARNTALLQRLLESWKWVEDAHARRPVGDVIRRAMAYLEKVPPAISGQHGHNQTYKVACILVRDFALTVEQALEAIQEWNRTCRPPWSEHELRHKLTDAAKKEGPIGAKVAPGVADVHSQPDPRPPSVESAFAEPIPASKLKAGEVPTWLWHGYLARGGVTLYSALWKAGKTTLLAHLLKAMEIGGTFCGQALDPARVLYITEESETRWAERRDRLGLKDHIEFLIRPFAAKPRWEQWQAFLDYLRGLVRARSYDLIAFDTLANLWPVRDENDASQVQSALMPMHHITEKASLLLVHHNRKGDGTEATASRGSGALTAFVDTIIELRRYDHEDRRDRRRVLTGYGRYDETPQEIVVELSEGGEYTCLGTKEEKKANDLVSTIVGLLPDARPGITFEELMSKWPGEKPPRRKVCFQALWDGAEKGMWQRSGEGVKGNPHRYWKNAVPAPGTESGTETECAPGGVEN